MKICITIIRLLLWAAMQSNPKIIVDKKFWIYPDRTVVRSDFLPFIKACQTLGEELFDLIHNNNAFINVKQILGLTSGTMHQALFQALLYTKVSEINDVLSDTYDAVTYLNSLLTSVNYKNYSSRLTYNKYITYLVHYFDTIQNTNLLDIDTADINLFIQSKINSGN